MEKSNEWGQGVDPGCGHFRISHLENDDYSTYSKQNFADTEAVRPDFFVDWFVGGDFPFFTERSQEITIVFEE